MLTQLEYKNYYNNVILTQLEYLICILTFAANNVILFNN